MMEHFDVAAIRNELGLSQAAFAQLLQVDQSSVSLWETKKTKPGGPARQVMLNLLFEHRRDHASRAAAGAAA